MFLVGKIMLILFLSNKLWSVQGLKGNTCNLKLPKYCLFNNMCFIIKKKLLPSVFLLADLMCQVWKWTWAWISRRWPQKGTESFLNIQCLAQVYSKITSVVSTVNKNLLKFMSVRQSWKCKVHKAAITTTSPTFLWYA